MKPAIRKRTGYVLIIVLTVITLATVALLCPFENEHQTTVEPISFSGTYQLNDGMPPQSLTDETYIDACTNDTVILRGTLSRGLEKGTQLLFFMEYLEVHIYLDGKEIYAWGTEADHPTFLRSAGAAWGHCTLPTALSPAEEIAITLESKYTNNYNSAYHDFLASLQTGDSGSLARAVLAENWLYLLAGLLLFLVGLTLQLFVLSLARQGVVIHASIHYCAFFTLSASLWIVLNPVYSTLILGNAPLIMLLETVCMWLFSFFLFGYFGAFMQTGARKANDLLLFGFVSALLLFLVLQLFGITDAYAVRELHNMLLCASAVAFLFIFWYEVRHAKDSEIRTLALPGLLYVVFGLVEMFNYEFEWLPRGGALTVGFTIFIIAQFVLAVRQIRDSLLMAVKAIALEKDLAESRTAIMLSQIQPHFLYNSLLGIKELCDVDPQKASCALDHFSYFLRRNLDALSSPRLIPFEKELAHIRDYLYLEEMRFERQLQVVWEVAFTNFMVPPLSFQPIVENAVRYGITKKDGGGTLLIRVEQAAADVVVTIQDDGVGFDMNAPKQDGRSHIGIQNVRERLRAQCGGELLVRSEVGVGTTVKILLPQEEGYQ